MKESILRVLEALRKHDAGRATTLTAKFGTLAEDKHAEFLVEVSEAALTAATASTAQAETQQLVAEARNALDQAKKIQSKNLIELKLTDSKLPAPAMNIVREHLKDQVVDETRIDAEIKLVRESFAAYANVGRVGGPRIDAGLDSIDKVQLAMDKMLGVKESGQTLYAERNGVKKLEGNVPGFRSIKESYIYVTGDRELQFGINGNGGFSKISEATSLTTDFPNILLNSMTKRLIQDYGEISGMHDLDMLITDTDVADFKSNDRVRLGYLADLSTVTEDAAYTDFAKPTDEKISYTATKRGNTLPVSRETILNDDLNKIAAFPSRIARAAHRTLKQFVINFFVTNPNYDPDGIAWFNASHNNLGVNPLSIDELIAREIVLFNQTEKDSSKPLGLTLDWIMVPIGLKAVAYKINTAQLYNPGVGIQEPNPFYQRFGANNERILVNELLAASDANDWYYGTNKVNAPFLEIGFVQGVREPQMFIQNDQGVNNMFSNDRLTYKVRHEYGGKPIDFRGVGKNVVP